MSLQLKPRTAYVSKDAKRVMIMGRTKDGAWWWSLGGFWYDDDGRFVTYRQHGTEWVHEREEPSYRDLVDELPHDPGEWEGIAEAR